MSIRLSDKNPDYKPAPEGVHIAVCHRIVDIGTQPDTGFGSRRKIVICWELPNEHIQTDRGAMPAGVAAIYTYSLNKKSNLRQDLERWRTRPFTKEELQGWDLAAILGKACQVQIIHTEEGRAKVDAVMAVPKGTPAPKPYNVLEEYSIEQGKNEAFQKLPEWIQKMCSQCEEWKPAKPEAPAKTAPAETGAAEPPMEDGSDVPF